MWVAQDLLCGSSAVSLYVLDRNKYQPKPNQQSNAFSVKNPYKGRRRVKDETKIPPDIQEKYTELILDQVLYNAEECQALRDFEPVKINTHCIFARKSILWGSKDYDKSLSVGQLSRKRSVFLKSLVIGSLHTPVIFEEFRTVGWPVFPFTHSQKV